MLTTRGKRVYAVLCGIAIAAFFSTMIAAEHNWTITGAVSLSVTALTTSLVAGMSVVENQLHIERIEREQRRNITPTVAQDTE